MIYGSTLWVSFVVFSESQYANCFKLHNLVKHVQRNLLTFIHLGQQSQLPTICLFEMKNDRKYSPDVS